MKIRKLYAAQKFPNIWLLNDSNWIKENAENKWLGCHCLLKDDEYTEMICHLSSDILTMLRNNIFDMISTFNSQGNFDHNYILEN